MKNELLVKDVMWKDVDIVDRNLSVQDGLDTMQHKKTKMLIVDKAHENDEYGVVLIADIAATNLIRAKDGASEEADYYYSLVTNEEKTGIIDKLNDGIFKLSHEVDDKDKNGKIIYRLDSNGSMDLVELAGEYHGEHYDRLKIFISRAGDYGTAKFKVSYLSNDQLEGGTTDGSLITGGLQHIYGGLYGRFTGTSAHTSDYWIVEVYGSHRKQTNKSNTTIELSR